MDYFNDHQKLFLTAFVLFAALTLLVAILPAINNQNNNSPLPGAEQLSDEARAGKAVYVANGCVSCHTQQVRNVEMDKVWGTRPSMAADYADLHRTDFWRNTATVMGTERTGPDLANIGSRQPSPEWHLLHLFQPRAVVGQSIMPAYPWLFDVKNERQPGEVEITVPDAYLSHTQGRIVATKEALQLVAYLQTLKQVPLVDTAAVPKFLYKKEKVLAKPSAGGNNEPALDGAALYATHCQSCHQPNGEGLKGAFPPLKGSPVVVNDNPALLIEVVMNGYNPREEYAVMPAVGTNANLKPEEIAAIIHHERTSWGNEARKVPVAEVKKILQFLKSNQNVKQ
jgi:cytochrome c oxidase cbb3-type subunit 2